MAFILFLYAFQIFIKYKTLYSVGPKFLRPGVSVVATAIPGGLSVLLCSSSQSHLRGLFTDYHQDPRGALCRGSVERTWGYYLHN